LSRRGTYIIQVQLIEYSVIVERTKSHHRRYAACNPTALEASYNYVGAEPS
jgi:hypothetical protein